MLAACNLKRARFAKIKETQKCSNCHLDPFVGFSVCFCISLSAELVSCPVLRVPAKASLDCTPAVGRGIGSKLHVCRLSCSAGSVFITTPAGVSNTGDTTGNNITTWCGTQTGYRWLHQLKNITLPSCSGTVTM